MDIERRWVDEGWPTATSATITVECTHMCTVVSAIGIDHHAFTAHWGPFGANVLQILQARYLATFPQTVQINI